jgi:hypothetical protein
MEKGSLDINLMDLKVVVGGDGKKDVDGGEFNDGSKHLNHSRGPQFE